MLTTKKLSEPDVRERVSTVFYIVDAEGFQLDITTVEHPIDETPVVPEDHVKPPESSFFKAKYDRASSSWVEGKPYSEILQTAKDKKLSELSTACNNSIMGRFTSVMDGVTYSFSNDMEAQGNFEKADRAFEKNRITEMAWTAYDTNGEVVRLLLTPLTFEPLYMDHLNHIQSNIAKFRDFLMPQVDAAATLEELEVIKW